MTCTCHDPVVFGHHHDRFQPHTYAAGETFTLTGGHLHYTIGGTDRTIPLTGAQIHWETAAISTDLGHTWHNLSNTTVTEWNWLETPQTRPPRVEPWASSENPAETL